MTMTDDANDKVHYLEKEMKQPISGEKERGFI